MRRKKLLLFVLTCLFLSYSCIQTLPAAPDPAGPEMFVTPFPSVENPMEMIEIFAKQTAAAQTQIANPYHPSPFDVTQTSSEFSADEKILYVVFFLCKSGLLQHAGF
jgi:hypothetical protein